MRLEIPIFAQILSDGGLPTRALQVWRCAIQFLDVVDWTPLKLAQIENVLTEVDASTVSRSLSLLVDRGYLCRQEGLYRVPLSRRDGTAEVVEAAVDTVSTVPRRSARKTRRVHSPGVL